LVEGRGVVVEAVACDGACTVDTNGKGSVTVTVTIIVMVMITVMAKIVLMIPVLGNGSHR